MLGMILLATGPGCGRKGDPIPRPRAEPLSCAVQWLGLRRLQVVLPTQDTANLHLVGIQSLRLYFMPLGSGRPTPAEILARGDVLLERSRPELPGPGETVVLDLKDLDRPPGWIVAVAARVGGVLGQPSESLPWLHSAVR
jgi:hypothetical protein